MHTVKCVLQLCSGVKLGTKRFATKSQMFTFTIQTCSCIGNFVILKVHAVYSRLLVYDRINGENGGDLLNSDTVQFSVLGNELFKTK